MKKLVSLLIIFVLILSAVAACSKDVVSESYWSVTKKSAGEGDYLEYYAILNVSGASSTKKINEVWVNVGDMGGESVKFNMAFGSSSSDSSLKYSKLTELSASAIIAKAAGGWVKICDDLSLTYNYAIVTTSDTMKFYEIVFLTEDHEVLKTSVKEAGERNPSVHTTGITYDLDNVDKEPYTHLADKIVDKQDEFNYDEINDLYERSVIKSS